MGDKFLVVSWNEEQDNNTRRNGKDTRKENELSTPAQRTNNSDFISLPVAKVRESDALKQEKTTVMESKTRLPAIGRMNIARVLKISSVKNKEVAEDIAKLQESPKKINQLPAIFTQSEIIDSNPTKLPVITPVQAQLPGNDSQKIGETNINLLNSSEKGIKKLRKSEIESENEKESNVSVIGSKIRTSSKKEAKLKSRETEAKTLKSNSFSGISKSMSPKQTRLREKEKRPQMNIKVELETIVEKLNKKVEKSGKEIARVGRDAIARRKESPRRTDTFVMQNRTKAKLESSGQKRGYSAGVESGGRRERKTGRKSNLVGKVTEINQKEGKDALSSTAKKDSNASGKLAKHSLNELKRDAGASIVDKSKNGGNENTKGTRKIETKETQGVVLRKFTQANLIYQLFNGEYYPITQPRISCKYNFGVGNNSEKVVSRIRLRTPFEMTQIPTSANLVWTQLLCRYMRPTTFQNFSKIQLSVLKDQFTGSKLNSEEEMTNQLLESKLFKVRDVSLVKKSFEKLLVRDLVMSVNSEQLYMNNHLRGLHFISRKYYLAKSIIEYCAKKGTDPFSIVPQTFFVVSETFESDMLALVKSVREVQEKAVASGQPWDPAVEYKVPIIIKPGEYSNRGKGIAIAYTERELKGLTNSLFSSKKKDQKAVLQTYLINPLLYKKRKFDLRCYCLLVKHFDRIVVYWYGLGYARTSSYDYDERNKNNLMVHLTNEAVQVKGIWS